MGPRAGGRSLRDDRTGRAGGMGAGPGRGWVRGLDAVSGREGLGVAWQWASVWV
jgi:hypothetical protein